MIVKSILQWRERQSESFGERILQALKGPCGSSTPHSACVLHTRSQFCRFFPCTAGKCYHQCKTPQDSQHPRARAVYIGNVVIPCQCVVKYQPKVFMCPDLGDGDPVHSHKWALFRCGFCRLFHPMAGRGAPQRSRGYPSHSQASFGFEGCKG